MALSKASKRMDALPPSMASMERATSAQHGAASAPAAHTQTPAAPARPALGHAQTHQFEKGTRQSASAPAPSTSSTIRASADPRLTQDLRNQLGAANANIPAPGTRGIGHGTHGVRDGGPVRSASGAVNMRDWERNPASVLGNLSQRPHQSSGAAAAHQDDRCGPSNLLGASVMNGPGATESTLRRTASNRGTLLDQSQRQRLNTIADHVHSGEVTYQELNEAQGLMYAAGNRHSDAYSDVLDAANHTRMNEIDRMNVRSTLNRLENREDLDDSDRRVISNLMHNHTGRPASDFQLQRVPDPQNPSRSDWVFRHTMANHGSGDDSAFDDGELSRLASVSTGGVTRPTTPDFNMRELLSGPPHGLQRGQAATIRLQGNVRQSRGSDHYVTLGRSPNGQYYLYNPDPGPGDATLVTGNRSQIQQTVERYNNRIRPDSDHDTPNLLITRPRDRQ